MTRVDKSVRVDFFCNAELELAIRRRFPEKAFPIRKVVARRMFSTVAKVTRG